MNNPTEVVKQNLKDDETTANSVNDNEELVQVERYGDLTIIGLNRTQKRNAINQPMSLKICEAITNFENDDTSTVGVLHGLGGSFSSGYDIGWSEFKTPRFVAFDILRYFRRFAKRYTETGKLDEFGRICCEL